MKRIIEELAASRKKSRQKFYETLENISNLISRKKFFQNKNPVRDALVKLGQDLDEWMTVQDKEWDALSNNHATMVFKSLQWKIEKLEAEYSQVKNLLIQFTNLEKSLRKIIDSLDTQITPETRENLKDLKEQLSVFQYSDFEHRFRGDENTVKEQVGRYLPFFLQTDNILDLGCGRGEFLEMLRQKGKTAQGIDISQSMLNLARAKGIPCQKGDILRSLQKMNPDSVGGIFSSQVIEHFEPGYLRDVVIECYRILKKDSPILLETISPLSVFALSRIFFLDVTHQKPVHPEYLRFLLENSGFSEVEVLYSGELETEKLEEIDPENPVARIFNTNVDKLNQIIFASPMYAIKGTKK